jgi:ribosome-binding factor A
VPAPRRIARLKQLILEVAATTIQRDVRDPRLGFVTVTRVDLAPDLTQATVYWSSLGTEAQRRTSERALEDARGMVQSTVARALATRTTPTLAFRFDPTLANAERLEGIFEKIKAQRPAPAETPTASSPRGEGAEEGGGRADEDASDDREADEGGADDRATDDDSADADEPDDDATADDRASDEAGEDEDAEGHADPA